MRTARRLLVQRTATWLAILAIALLSLLTPIHHIHAFKADLGRSQFGDDFRAIICTANGLVDAEPADSERRSDLSYRCAVCMLGRVGVSLVLPGTAPIGPSGDAVIVSFVAAPEARLQSRIALIQQPRAPPIVA